MKVISTLSTSNVDSRYTSNPKIKEMIEQLRLANQNANSASQGDPDPAYTVEISDEARELYNQQAGNGKTGETTASSLFTQAGRAETTQRYNQVFDELFSTYGEEEAVRRFDDFMRSEGYERKGDSAGESITAPKFGTGADRNLSSYSYLNASVMDGKEHILAATWATYTASSASGPHTYQKKIADSFDLAADTRTIIKDYDHRSKDMHGEKYESQIQALWNKIDKSLEQALTTGSMIDSTVTEEEFTETREFVRNNYTTEAVLVSVEKIDDPADKDGGTFGQVSDGNSRLEALKAKFRPKTIRRNLDI